MPSTEDIKQANAAELGHLVNQLYKVNNPFMAGERKTPDDDGITSSIVELVVFGMLKYVGYL
jgi:hypothetical protein